jgi:hypothetical protein
MREVLPPSRSAALQSRTDFLSVRDKWERSGTPEKVFTVCLSSSALLTLFTFCIGQFFQIRGVQHMLTSRIFLAGACLILVAGLWGYCWIWQYTRRWYITIVGVLFLTLAAYLLDRAYPMPTSATPPLVSTPLPSEVERNAQQWLENEEGMYKVKSTSDNPSDVYWRLLVTDRGERKIHVVQFTEKPDRLSLIAVIYIAENFNSLPSKTGEKTIRELRKGLIQMGVHYDDLGFRASSTMLSLEVPINPNPNMSKDELLKGVDKLFGAVVYVRGEMADAVNDSDKK